MLRKMGEALARVARKVNETVESDSDTLDLAECKLLCLEGNFLYHLPNEVSALQHFKAIHLSRNQFHDFPEQLTPLPALETIILEENKIVDVPMEKLAAMTALCSINLHFNPLNAEVRVIALPLIKFDMLMSPEGTWAPPP
ncbi:leucine-rich repeat-containing protein 20-like isoform X2 [Myotis yumanensis]|uniref:leucine-rich repeat-containing protein 20-like isoform X2 n=1 Tax=Myotis yumanensis TaxID=159337 RepID=UPI0038CF6F66